MQPPQMLQDEKEFAEFLSLIADLGVRRYLEIGSKFGGTLFRVGMVMPAGSLCVGVDLPNGHFRYVESEQSLKATQGYLEKQGRTCHLVWGDSTDARTIEEVRKFAPFDLAFIDANHTLPYVQRDYANYLPMVTKGIAFHDISWRRDEPTKKTPIDCPIFWQEIKGKHNHREIRHDPSGKNNGIGVILL